MKYKHKQFESFLAVCLLVMIVIPSFGTVKHKKKQSSHKSNLSVKSSNPSEAHIQPSDDLIFDFDESDGNDNLDLMGTFLPPSPYQSQTNSPIIEDENSSKLYLER